MSALEIRAQIQAVIDLLALAKFHRQNRTPGAQEADEKARNKLAYMVKHLSAVPA